jgi:uncharacterized protein (DUF1330 family)
MIRRLVALATFCAAAGMSAGRAQAPSVPPAYFIAEFQLTDPQGIKPYSAAVEGTFRPFGGHFVARTSRIVGLEGTPPRDRFIIIGFDTMAQARAWYDSPAYVKLRPIRQRSGITRAYLVEGLPASQADR